MKKIKFELSILQGLVAKMKKLPLLLAEYAFLTFLFFLFLILILAGFIFYKYSILAEKEEPEILEKTFQFEEGAYREILKEWKEREKIFEGASEKEYLDPFRAAKQEKEVTEAVPGNNKNQEEKPEEEPETLIYTTLKGDTLWGIAQQYLGSGTRWREITDEKGEIFTEDAAEILQPGKKLIVPLR